MSARLAPLTLAIGLVLAIASPAAAAADDATAPAKPAYKPAGEILAASPAGDWRTPDPENLLYMDLPAGRVVMELAPGFVPLHAANIRTLVREKYFDGLAVIRSQDNYVVQWGDPEEDEKKARPLGSAKASFDPEFSVPVSAATPFDKLPDGDVYAPQVGFGDGFPAARDAEGKQTWLTHCYGAVGVARGNDPKGGNGSGLYVIIGHAPRHLDRNVTVVGRVLQGMELLSTLPRGSGTMGFYEKPEQRVPIASIRVAADVPESERTPIEVLRTDSTTFEAVTEARRNRRDDWTVNPAGRIELCNVQLPVRAPKP
jgi:cyclophilin family peptidyl-prolyl cis-trans isomerase